MDEYNTMETLQIQEVFDGILDNFEIPKSNEEDYDFDFIYRTNPLSCAAGKISVADADDWWYVLDDLDVLFNIQLYEDHYIVVAEPEIRIPYVAKKVEQMICQDDKVVEFVLLEPSNEETMVLNAFERYSIRSKEDETERNKKTRGWPYKLCLRENQQSD